MVIPTRRAAARWLREVAGSATDWRTEAGRSLSDAELSRVVRQVQHNLGLAEFASASSSPRPPQEGSATLYPYPPIVRMRGSLARSKKQVESTCSNNCASPAHPSPSICLLYTSPSPRDGL